jgi:4-amino-4-deoxychorismate lyase
LNTNTYLETIACKNGEPLHLHYHQARLNTTLETLNIHTTYDLATLITPPDNAYYRCRFIYDATGFTIEYHPYTLKFPSTLRLITDNTIDYPLKSTNRTSLNLLFGERNGCDDILIVKNGFITDTTIANVAFFINDQWLTPKKPLLYGTTRARLLDENKIFPADITVQDALAAQKISVMNAMIGCIEMDNGIILC